MFAEDALLPISALQHLIFCERQCALIHIERLWAENRLTVEGRHLHEKAHDGPRELIDGVRITRGLAIRSLRLGLIGQADVVEFHSPSGDGTATIPFPIEYKRGRPKPHDADRVQLCAQALCLEEMLAVEIRAGALYYGTTRRRRPVAFDDTLRTTTEAACARLHGLIASGRTPRAVREPKCDQCSLIELCLPDALSPSHGAAAYLERAIRASLRAGLEVDPRAERAS